jgi:BirA family transcriptional regulator, biotin operon repressor / biotin---[acetyl-CoA-carboxylase] ligase
VSELASEQFNSAACSRADERSEEGRVSERASEPSNAASRPAERAGAVNVTRRPDRPTLDAAALRHDLVGTDSLWQVVDVLPETGSTNEVVAERGRAGEPEGVVVVAEHQTAGRGRLARRWVAPPRSSLLLSVLLRPDSVAAGRWPWLPLLAGVAVHDCVTGVAAVDARLKWPNDVLVSGRKAAGVLVERVDSDTGPAAVIGIGLNVSLGPAELPSESSTSLAIAGAATTDRATILIELLRRLASRYRDWTGAGGDPDSGLRADYVAACDTIGREVRVELPDGSALVGQALGVDAQGRLEVDADGVYRAVGAGDVVHLRSGS